MQAKAVKRFYQNFESSTGPTPEWNSFYRSISAHMRKTISPFGHSLKMSKGHFYFSGFFTHNSGQVFYFSSRDVRYFNGESILIRTATSYTDYTGGPNSYVKLEDFGKHRFFKQEVAW